MFSECVCVVSEELIDKLGLATKKGGQSFRALYMNRSTGRPGGVSTDDHRSYLAYVSCVDSAGHVDNVGLALGLTVCWLCWLLFVMVTQGILSFPCIRVSRFLDTKYTIIP